MYPLSPLDFLARHQSSLLEVSVILSSSPKAIVSSVVFVAECAATTRAVNGGRGAVAEPPLPARALALASSLIGDNVVGDAAVACWPDWLGGLDHAGRVEDACKIELDDRFENVSKLRALAVAAAADAVAVDDDR